MLLPQPLRVFSIRGLRLYFIALEPWVARSASLPAIHPGLSVRKCGAVGSATHHTACSILRHSESGPLALSVCKCRAAGSASGQRSCHGNGSPLRPGCPSPLLLPVWMNVYFLSPWCQTSLPFDFLSVLAVQGGTVCLPTPPSWFSQVDLLLIQHLLSCYKFLMVFQHDKFGSNSFCLVFVVCVGE